MMVFSFPWLVTRWKASVSLMNPKCRSSIFSLFSYICAPPSCTLSAFSISLNCAILSRKSNLVYPCQVTIIVIVECISAHASPCVNEQTDSSIKVPDRVSSHDCNSFSASESKVL
eukprot:01291.XXX_3758_4102_1 [CDS] Oithona nana genome sequencing.